jgi:hypothetical protein
VRETKGGVGARACVLPEMHKCPRAPCGRKHLPGSGLDVFRVRSGLRVQRCVAPTHVEHVERRRSDAPRGGRARRYSCEERSVNRTYSSYLWLGTHNSNTFGRTNPRPAGLVINGSARAETKVQTANRVWQRIAKDEVECNLLQTQRPKKNRHA